MNLLFVVIFIVGAMHCVATTMTCFADNNETIEHPTFGHHYQRDMVFNGIFRS